MPSVYFTFIFLVNRVPFYFNLAFPLSFVSFSFIQSFPFVFLIGIFYNFVFNFNFYHVLLHLGWLFAICLTMHLDQECSFLFFWHNLHLFISFYRFSIYFSYALSLSSVLLIYIKNFHVGILIWHNLYLRLSFSCVPSRFFYLLISLCCLSCPLPLAVVFILFFPLA